MKVESMKVENFSFLSFTFLIQLLDLTVMMVLLNRQWSMLRLDVDVTANGDSVIRPYAIIIIRIPESITMNINLNWPAKHDHSPNQFPKFEMATRKGISSGFLWFIYKYAYFHSQTFDEQFPISSNSYSNTATTLLRDDSFPPSPEGVRKNNDPRKLILPGPVNLPIP